MGLTGTLRTVRAPTQGQEGKPSAQTVLASGEAKTLRTGEDAASAFAEVKSTELGRSSWTSRAGTLQRRVPGPGAFLASSGQRQGHQRGT